MEGTPAAVAVVTSVVAAVMEAAVAVVITDGSRS